MLKRSIKYTDYDGVEVTEVFYFNLSKIEAIELQLSEEEGFGENLQRLANSDNNQKLFAEFKRIILMSFGEKSADGKRFIKTDELRTNFEQSAAFDALFMELMTDSNNASTFINGVLPKGIFEQVEAMQAAGQLPPPPPPPPST